MYSQQLQRKSLGAFGSCSVIYSNGTVCQNKQNM